jgi:hypothetical protein
MNENPVPQTAKYKGRVVTVKEKHRLEKAAAKETIRQHEQRILQNPLRGAPKGATH